MGEDSELSEFENLYYSGQYQQLLDLSQVGDTVQNDYWKMTALWRLGRFEDAIDVGLQTKERFSKDDIEWRAKVLHRIGTLYHAMADLEISLDYYQQSLSLKQIIGNEVEIADTLNNIGIIHYDQGEFDLALKYYERSLELKLKHKRSKDIAPSLNNIAIVYRTMGELNPALSYFTRCLELNQANNNQQDISYSLQNIGKIHRDRGEYKEAMKYFSDSLDIRLAIGNMYNIAEMYMDMIVTLAEIDKLEEAKGYLKQLEKVASQDSNRKIALFNNYATAILLKASKRIKDTGKAQEIFADLLQENDFDFYLQIKIYGHLVELLIYEYKSFEDESVLQEILLYTTRMLEVANDQHMFTTQVDVLLLQSKLAIIQNDFDRCHTLLLQAKQLAKSKHLQQYTDYIEQEEDNLRVNLNDLKDIIKNSSVSSKLEETALLDYIKVVQKSRE